MEGQTITTTAVEGELLLKNFQEYIINDHFPCIMAQTVFKTDRVKFYTYSALGSSITAISILKDLEQYLAEYDFESNDFLTFIAAFPNDSFTSEAAFEAKLWSQLQYLHEADNALWDPTVSADPEKGNFSFSLLGKAFYIVGLHPASSRISRQSPVPAIVFNLHFQFEKLREVGSYETIRNKIRERDEALQGNINPMLSDFGLRSEAPQYSGRQVGNSWKCPFRHK